MDSFNVIISTEPITDEQADRLVTHLALWSPVIDGDGSITLTVMDENQTRAFSFALFLLMPFSGSLLINSAEVMTAEAYDATYVVVPT